MLNYLAINFKKEKWLSKKSALRTTLIFTFTGIVWIGIPTKDIFRNNFMYINNIEVFQSIRTISFIAISSIIIYFLILKHTKIFNKALYEAKENINMQKSIEKGLKHMAYYDRLTNLPNRAFFEKKFKELTLADNNAKFAFLYMDIDNFKNINDTMGHIAGDEFLIYVSEILKTYSDDKKFVSRFGGDEFVFIFENIHKKEDIKKEIKNLQKLFVKPWKYNNYNFFISLSIGVVFYPENGKSFEILLRNSDVAMYQVKKHQKNNYCIFSNSIHENIIKKTKIANELYRAISNNEFFLMYQPVINLCTGELTSLEALVRWDNPNYGIISPSEFIPVAEEIGVINEIGRIVFQNALKQKMDWKEKELFDFCISINVSGKSLLQSDFIQQIDEIIAQTNICADEIIIEITETVLIEDLESSSRVLSELSKKGFKIALDDFGTGYSSLTYLRNLPIDIIKLDGSFVNGIMENGEDVVIVESVIKLAHDLNLKMVAEGIEDVAQLTVLVSNNCDYGQGYFFSKPVTSKQIEDLFCNLHTRII